MQWAAICVEDMDVLGAISVVQDTVVKEFPKVRGAKNGLFQ